MVLLPTADFRAGDHFDLFGLRLLPQLVEEAVGFEGAAGPREQPHQIPTRGIVASRSSPAEWARVLHPGGVWVRAPGVLLPGNRSKCSALTPIPVSQVASLHEEAILYSGTRTGLTPHRPRVTRPHWASPTVGSNGGPAV